MSAVCSIDGYSTCSFGPTSARVEQQRDNTPEIHELSTDKSCFFALETPYRVSCNTSNAPSTAFSLSRRSVLPPGFRGQAAAPNHSYSATFGLPCPRAPRRACLQTGAQTGFNDCLLTTEKPRQSDCRSSICKPLLRLLMRAHPSPPCWRAIQAWT